MRFSLLKRVLKIADRENRRRVAPVGAGQLSTDRHFSDGYSYERANRISQTIFGSVIPVELM